MSKENAAGNLPIPSISLRNWFAGVAMQGMISDDRNCHAADMAARAFDIADAMVTESYKRCAAN
jgi:hypothetical protein